MKKTIVFPKKSKKDGIKLSEVTKPSTAINYPFIYRMWVDPSYSFKTH